MNKTVKIIIAIAVVLVVVVAIVLLSGNSKTKSNLSINSAEELTTLVDQIYESVSVEMPEDMLPGSEVPAESGTMIEE